MRKAKKRILSLLSIALLAIFLANTVQAVTYHYVIINSGYSSSYMWYPRVAFPWGGGYSRKGGAAYIQNGIATTWVYCWGSASCNTWYGQGNSLWDDDIPPSYQGNFPQPLWYSNWLLYGSSKLGGGYIIYPVGWATAFAECWVKFDYGTGTKGYDKAEYIVYLHRENTYPYMSPNSMWVTTVDNEGSDNRYVVAYYISQPITRLGYSYWSASISAMTNMLVSQYGINPMLGDILGVFEGVECGNADILSTHDFIQLRYST